MRRQTALGWFQHDIQNRGVSAWVLSAILIGFYVVLYFGYDIRNPGGAFERVQAWLYEHFTRHLDALGATLFGAVADTFAYWQVSLVVYGPIVAGTAWLLWSYRDDRPKLLRSLLAGGVSLAFAIGLMTILSSMGFFASDNLNLDAEQFNRWHVYGLLYTLAILIGGVYVTWKYKHNKYQVVRTLIVIFVQVSFAFSIPILLKFFSHPEYYFSYLWPLKIDYLDPKNFAYYGEVLVLYGFFGSLLLVPVMTVLYGKRWYCSWVCGCGGLANTAGEPFRHLSDKSSVSWQIEKFTIHSVLVIAILSTALWFVSALLPDNGGALANTSEAFRKYYGIIVVAGLSGAAGTGLYPLGGTRVWCRFFCPMAALLGLIQKFGRFRIRVKENMCISCGLCSKYCEMGIDVRAYAQANESFTRASCVGCGMCAEVCPRGVLRLENRLRRDPQELTVHSLIDESWKGPRRNVAARH